MDYLYPNEEVCVPADQWTTMVKYYWAAPLFDEEDRRFLISADKKLEREDALNFYAWGRQAKFGNNDFPRPPIYNLMATMRYDAWEAIRGKIRLQSATQYLNAARPLLAMKGLSVDRDAEDLTESYNSCVEIMKDEGLNLSQIKTQTAKYLENANTNF